MSRLRSITTLEANMKYILMQIMSNCNACVDNRSVIPTGNGEEPKKQRLTNSFWNHQPAHWCCATQLCSLTWSSIQETPSGRHLYQTRITAADVNAGIGSDCLGNEPLSQENVHGLPPYLNLWIRVVLYHKRRGPAVGRGIFRLKRWNTFW